VKRALVFGGTGMLGRAVAAHWRRRGAAALALSHAQADVTDRGALAEWTDRFRPELVVNCAAFTRVDDCETERERAMATNGAAVANVVAAAERAGADLVQVSTDYVFDGESGLPYGEDAPTAPLSVYGESKLAGEREALVYPRSLVVRSSWLFGPGGPNFVTAMLRLAGGPLRVVDDQVGCPTYTPFLARAIWDLAGHGTRGVIHYCNRDAVSWYGFAREILGPHAEIEPVTTAEFPRPAPRPARSVLDVSRFERVAGRRVEPWTHGLGHYLETSGDDP
jgi:dTDP-4-dehydrorhamnose reductase